MQQGGIHEYAGAVNAASKRGGAAAVCRSRRLRRVVSLILVLLAWPLLPATPGTKAQSRLPDEYRIKADFIYNFAQFIEWPAAAFASPDAPFLVGILGDDPFGRVFEQTVGGKTVGDRAVRIHRFGAGQDLSGCHILFIGAAERGRWPDIRHKLKGASVLTVADMERFATRGGMIGLLIEERKIRFEVNVEAAARAQLKISSRLLSLARAVRHGVTD